MTEPQRYLELRIVADDFGVELGWLEEVFDVGLLQHARRDGRRREIAVADIDRVAEIVRLERQGLNIPGILWHLEGR